MITGGPRFFWVSWCCATEKRFWLCKDSFTNNRIDKPKSFLDVFTWDNRATIKRHAAWYMEDTMRRYRCERSRPHVYGSEPRLWQGYFTCLKHVLTCQLSRLKLVGHTPWISTHQWRMSLFPYGDKEWCIDASSCLLTRHTRISCTNLHFLQIIRDLGVLTFLTQM